jgi:hypothetical protein
MHASNKRSAPQPSVNFHARIDLATEECRRRLQEQMGLSAPQLVSEAFRELERRLCRGKTTPTSTVSRVAVAPLRRGATETKSYDHR